MDGQLLPHGTAVGPFVAACDVPYSRIVGHQTVDAVFHDILCPVVLGIDAAVSQPIGGIGNRIFRLFGSLHLAIGRDASLHLVIDIAVQEGRSQSCTYTDFTHVDRLGSRSAADNDIDVDTADTLAQDKALLQLRVVVRIGIYHFRVVIGLSYNLGLGRTEGVILVCRIVKIHATAANDIAATLQRHVADAAVAADGNGH